MTPDELVSELYIRQGYLVIETVHKRDVGELHKFSNGGGTMVGPCVIPLRVVGISNQEEFHVQCHLANEICGTDVPLQDDYFPVSYFYRVEAAD